MNEIIPELTKIIKTFVFGNIKTLGCCENCGISLSFSKRIHMDYTYNRIFCCRTCILLKLIKDQRKKENRKILNDKRNNRKMKYIKNIATLQALSHNPKVLLEYPFYEEDIKFNVCTDKERSQLINLETREWNRRYNNWEQWLQKQDRYYWLKYPLGSRIIAWDSILGLSFNGDDGVYAFIVNMLK